MKVEVAVLGSPVPNSPYGLCGRNATLNLNCVTILHSWVCGHCLCDAVPFILWLSTQVTLLLRVPYHLKSLSVVLVVVVGHFFGVSENAA